MSSYVERGRTLARSQALQLLFQSEALGLSVHELIDSSEFLLSRGPLSDYARELAVGTYENMNDIDAKISETAHNWTISRMPAADRNLLRLATYEMLHVESLPAIAIAINEAVEIAKAYGTDDSAKFVNGVLGRIAANEGVDSSELAASVAEEASLPHEEVVLDETEE